jgi:hypothetical protein
MSKLVKPEEMVEGRCYARNYEGAPAFRAGRWDAANGFRYVADNDHAGMGALREWREVCEHGKAVRRAVGDTPYWNCSQQACRVDGCRPDGHYGITPERADEVLARSDRDNPTLETLTAGGPVVDDCDHKGVGLPGCSVCAHSLTGPAVPEPKSLVERWRGERKAMVAEGYSPKRHETDRAYCAGKAEGYRRCADELERERAKVSHLPTQTWDPGFLALCASVLTDRNIASAELLRERLGDPVCAVDEWNALLMQTQRARDEASDANQRAEQAEAKLAETGKRIEAVACCVSWSWLNQNGFQNKEQVLSALYNDPAAIERERDETERRDEEGRGIARIIPPPPRGPIIRCDNGHDWDGDET